MNNKELQELLKEYPDDALIGYFHPTKDIQTVDHVEPRGITNPAGSLNEVLFLNMTNFKYKYES